MSEHTEAAEKAEASKKRWSRTAYFLIGLLLLLMVGAAWNVTLVQTNNRQDAQLAQAEANASRLQAQIKAADDLRASEARAEAKRKILACRLSKEGVKQANAIVGNIKKLALDLADSVSRPEVAAILRADAARFPTFPAVVCGKPGNQGPGKD